MEVFKNDEFGSVRALVINDEPWFVGKDVAEVLGYEDTKKAIKSHVEKEDRWGGKTDTPYVIDSLGRKQYPTLINESGLYSLIISSKLESAKKFKHWVTSEVLPNLRKTGRYNIRDSYTIEDPIERARRWIEEQEEKQALLAENAELKPKALFADAISASEGSITVGALAKLLLQNGINIGQNRLFEWFRDNGYLIKDGRNKNLPTQRYAKSGLFELRGNLIFVDGKPVERKPTTLVTGKGQKYFINMFLKGLKF